MGPNPDGWLWMMHEDCNIIEHGYNEPVFINRCALLPKRKDSAL